MIKKNEELLKFEDELKRKTKVNVKKNFQIVEAMYDEAVALGVMPPESKLDGIENDIKIAKVVNSV